MAYDELATAARAIHAAADKMQRTWTRAQARFWIVGPTGNLVRIKLNPGQTVHHFWAQRTDEGYTSEASTYTFDGRNVTAEHYNDGADCDGRVSDSYESRCEYHHLRAGNLVDGERFPLWLHGHSAHRDYAAEAAGY